MLTGIISTVILICFLFLLVVMGFFMIGIVDKNEKNAIPCLIFSIITGITTLIFSTSNLPYILCDIVSLEVAGIMVGLMSGFLTFLTICWWIASETNECPNEETIINLSLLIIYGSITLGSIFIVGGIS